MEGSQDQHLRFSSDFSGHEAAEAPGNAASRLAASKNQMLRAARIRDPPWANHTTAATCDSTCVGCSTANTLARPRENHFTATDSNLCSFENISPNCPTVGFLSTRDLAYWAKRKVFRASATNKRLFGQLSETSTVVQHLRTVSVKRQSSHFCSQTVFNELVKRRLCILIFHQMQLILQKPDMSLNNSNLPMCLTSRHLNFNASSCTPLSKPMGFERTSQNPHEQLLVLLQTETKFFRTASI